MPRPTPNFFLTAALFGTLFSTLLGTGAHAQSPTELKQRAALEAALPKNQYWFGVAVENIPPVIAKQLKLHKDQGLMVVSVLPNSPAEKAGLKADDLLVEINGRPLTSQEELAHAANILRAPETPKSVEQGSSKSPTKGEEATPQIDDKAPPEPPARALLPVTSKITYLREGDRTTVNIVPEQRPTSMVAMGANLANFQPNAGGDPKGASQGRARNYVLPNGAQAQVGPGYRLDLNGPDASMTIQSIKSIVSGGQTVVLTRETDAHGQTRASITVGSVKHDVDPAHLDKLPQELRPLAEQLLKTPPTRSPSVPSTRPATPAMEERVKELEKQNRLLQEQLKALMQHMNESAPTTQKSD